MISYDVFMIFLFGSADPLDPSDPQIWWSLEILGGRWSFSGPRRSVRSMDWEPEIHRKIIRKSKENYRKIIGKVMVIIMDIFGPNMGEMYLNNTFNSFIVFYLL